MKTSAVQYRHKTKPNVDTKSIKTKSKVKTKLTLPHFRIDAESALSILFIPNTFWYRVDTLFLDMNLSHVVSI